jgi:hypothetical protein
MNIKSIIPANGWVAMFKQDDQSLDSTPLVCFGIVDGETGHEIKGFVAEGDSKALMPVDYVDNFAGYEFRP